MMRRSTEKKQQSSLYAYRSTYVCGLVCDEDDDKAIKITTTKKFILKKAYKHSYYCFSFFAQSARNIMNACSEAAKTESFKLISRSFIQIFIVL